MNEILSQIPKWFVFGAVAFLGAFTVYSAIRSKIVQAVSVFILAMIGGFATIALFFGT
jgi:hypothetical protein